MKNNRLRVGLALIIVLYGGFMAYFCMAKPGEPNDVVIEQGKTTDSNTVSANTTDKVETKVQEEKTTVDNPTSSQDKTIGQNVIAIKTVSPEFYLCKITDFYETIIMILSTVIFIILVISFVYVHLTSKRQAEDMAREALEEASFRIILQNMIAKSANEFVEGYSGIPELEERVEFLEEQINNEGYEFNDEDSSGGQDS